MLKPVRVTAPTALPLSLDEVKKHCRVDYDDDDDYLTALMEAATAYADGYSGILGRALMTQTWDASFCDFNGCLRLPLSPVQSITSVKYYDSDNVDQTLATSVYQLLEDAQGPRVALAYNQAWPGGLVNRADAVRVRFLAGYSSASAIPAAIRHALLLMIGNWYENREAVVIGQAPAVLPIGAQTLLAPYRRIGI